MGQTLFPALAHVQEDKERVNRILMEATSWLILLGLPAVVVIYLCAQSLLTVIYGARYVAAAGPLAVAAIVVFLNVLNAAITCVFTAVGRPGLHRRAVAASAVVMLIAVYPCCKLLGLVGGQVASLLAIIVSYFLQVMRMREAHGLRPASLCKSLCSGGACIRWDSCCRPWRSLPRLGDQADSQHRSRRDRLSYCLRPDRASLHKD